MNNETSPLVIAEGPDPGALRISGDLDSYTCGALAESIGREQIDQQLTIDLSEVRFIDSSGLRVLVAGHEARSGTDGPLVLVNPSRAVLRMLDITALTDLLNIMHTRP